ncbi:MAG: DUF1501 domain-containing protein [Planctomycetes bacterium]|nr:DUF1501 domain-containing protein [Planctomycetota bacterium]
MLGSSQPGASVVNRRSFLQAGVLGVGGLARGDFQRLLAQQGNKHRKDTSVILVWMSGGPGHMETWDPKPDAVSAYRGPFGAIKTSVPGVQFGELCPEQAKLMDRLAVVRSVNHGSGDHTKGNHFMLTGFEGPAFNVPNFRQQLRPSMGSATAKLRGANQPGLPPYVAVPHLRGGTDNFFHYSAYLGTGYNPLIVESDPNLPQFKVRNLTLAPDLTFDRLEDRKSLLEGLDSIRRGSDRSNPGLDEQNRRAFDLLTSRRVADAFNIAAEPNALRDRYGRHIFGQSTLLARRLVEAGVTFVTVNTEPWDHHGTANRLATEPGARKLIPPVDTAIAALIEDLISRGLYEKTLVVAMGEFGRTPRMNPEGGRDHWGNVFSVLMGCGSMKMGQTVGKSTARGEHVFDRPFTPQDVAATGRRSKIPPAPNGSRLAFNATSPPLPSSSSLPAVPPAVSRSIPEPSVSTNGLS